MESKNRTKKYKLQLKNIHIHKKSKLKLLKKQEGGTVEGDKIVEDINTLITKIQFNILNLKKTFGNRKDYHKAMQIIIDDIINNTSVIVKKLTNDARLLMDQTKRDEIDLILNGLNTLKITLQSANINPQNPNLFNGSQLNQRMIGIIIMDDFINILRQSSNNLLIPLLHGNLGQGNLGQGNLGYSMGTQQGLQGFLQQQLQQSQDDGINKFQEKEIAKKIKDLLVFFLPRILTSLKTSKIQSSEQVKEFKKLTKAFKEMEEKQKEIKEITSQIKFKEITKAKIFVNIEHITSTPSRPLNEILNDSVAQEMKKLAEVKTPLLNKDVWKDMIGNIVSNQSSLTQTLGSTQQSSMFSQGQQTSMFSQGQQGQQGQQIKGLIQPDLRVLGFGKPLSANLMQQINSIPFDLNEPTHQNQAINYLYNHIYDKIKQNPGMSQKDFIDLMSSLPDKAKPDNVFLRHPYGLFILTIPNGINWLLNNENGNKFIPNVINMGNFRKILEERMVPQQVDSTITSLAAKANEVATKTAQQKTQTDLLLAQGLGQQGQVQGIQQMMK